MVPTNSPRILHSPKDAFIKIVLMLCCGLILGTGSIRADQSPSGVWQSLGKIRVDRFVAENESRSEVIEKLNQALHKAEPDTKIEISFRPPPITDNIDEAKYTHSMRISAYNSTMLDLLHLVSMYDVDWKVKGNKVIGSQGRTD